MNKSRLTLAESSKFIGKKKMEKFASTTRANSFFFKAHNQIPLVLSLELSVERTKIYSLLFLFFLFSFLEKKEFLFVGDSRKRIKAHERVPSQLNKRYTPEPWLNRYWTPGQVQHAPSVIAAAVSSASLPFQCSGHYSLYAAQVNVHEWKSNSQLILLSMFERSNHLVLERRANDS